MSDSYSLSQKSQDGKRLGSIKPANGRLAFERIVKLPYDLAVVYSAVQNFRFDLAKGVYYNMDIWEQVAGGYFDDATAMMIEDRQNLYPGDNDEPWIQRADAIGKISQFKDQPPYRMLCLKTIFDMLFERNDPTLLAGELCPDPLVHNETISIDKHLTYVRACLEYH